jgi:ABC-2 type transport system permease protein
MEESTTMRVIPERDGSDRSEAAVRFGIASAARDVAIAVGIVLGLLYLLPNLGRVMSSPSWRGDPRRSIPTTGGLRLPADVDLSRLSIGALAGPGLLVGLAACALLVGGLLLLRFCDA